MNPSNQNPFQAPDSRVIDSVGASTEKLRSVAKARRFVSVAVLLETIWLLLNIVATARIGLPAAVIVFYMFAAWRLAHALHGTQKAVFYCLATLVPGVRIISLLVLDWRASRLLGNDLTKVHTHPA